MTLCRVDGDAVRCITQQGLSCLINIDILSLLVDFADEALEVVLELELALLIKVGLVFVLTG